MAFDTQAARKAGYSDDEIADYLSSQSGFDAAAARKAGYSSGEIIQAISTRAGQPANDAKPDQGLTPLDTEQVTSARPWQGAGAGRGSPNDPRRVDVEQPKKASGLIGAELGQLRDEAFMGVQQSGAAVSNINAFAQANRLANTEQLIRDLETRGRGDSAAASRLRAEADSLRERLPATVGTAAEANADTQRASQMTMRPAIKKVSEAKTFGDAWEAFKEAPYDVIAGVTAQSLPQVLPGLIATAVTGPAAGAAAMGLNSGVVEFGSSLTDFAQDKGIDTRNAKAVQNFYADPANLSDALKYAGTRAGIIGTMDAASGGIAGKTLAPAMRSPIKRQAVNMPAQMAVQGAAGGGGEAAAQLATKGEIDQPGQVFLEVAGELGGAPAEVAAFTREAAGSPQGQAARALAADLESGQLPAAQVETLNPNLAIQRKTQDGLINIGAAQTVDEAIAAATKATSPQDRAVDNIARILGETPNVSQPGDVRPLDSGTAGLGAPEPGIGLEAGMGTDGAAGRPLDAGRVPDQPDRGAAPLADRGPDAQLSPDVADTTARIRQMEGAPTTAEPASMWFGRRGDGYQTPEDASAALPSRQRVSPDLEWKVEQMPSGRYRLAGYDTQTQQPASFNVTLNPTGTATIIGNPQAIKATLAQAGIDKVMTGTDRVVVGTSQAQAAVQALEQKQPPALVNTARPAIESVANDQNNQTREDTQAQAPTVETTATAGSDAPGAAAVPATAGTGVGVEAAGVEPAKAPPNRTAYVAEVRRQLGDLQPGDVLENDMGDKWTVDVVMRNKAGEVTGFLPREGNPETGEREMLDLDAAGSVLLPTPYLDASGNRKLSQPGKVNRAQPATPAEPQTEVPAEGAAAVEAAGVGETIVSANSTENIDGVRAAKQSGKKLAYGQYGDGTVTVGPSLDAKTHITLRLAPAERKALNKANALDKLAESLDERQEANKALEDALAPAIDRAISKAATDPGTTQVEGGGVEPTDYLAELFGSQEQRDAAQAKYVADQDNRKAAVQRIRDEIARQKERATAEYDDWSGRKYKSNKTQVDLQGDGPSNQASMSIGAINESRRRNAMDALAKELAEIDKLAAAAETESGAEKILANLTTLRAKAAEAVKSGNWPGSTEDSMFESMLLDALKFRGPAGKGNVTSNGLSKAMLAAINGAPPNPPTQAQAGTLAEGAGESRPAPVAAPDPRLIPVSQRKQAPYSGPADVSSRAGQIELANRGGRIASLKAMNEQLRKIAPGEAWADSNIESATDLDALQSSISQALVDAGRARANPEQSPLKARLDELSGQELRAVFDVMSLAGSRMTATERVNALLAENPQEVEAALDQVSPRNVPKKQANLNTSAEPAQKTAESEQVEANDQTPKQYHDARLRKMSDDTGTPLAEVREFYDTEGGRAESDRLWSAMVDKRARDGATLARQTLDKFYELNPTARLPETAFPNGYQRPDARKQEAIAKDAIRQDRREAKAARAASEEQVGPYGRDLTPIAQGGKPFKTQAEAAKFRKKNTNGMVIKKTDKGYVLTEASAKQLAAWEKAGKRLGLPQTAGEGPQHVHGFLMGKGGLSKAMMQDSGFDRNPQVGNRTLFAREGGLTAERATELLAEAGYLRPGASHSEMFDLVRRSLTTPQYTADGWDRIAQAEQSAQFEDYLSAEQDVDEDPFGPATEAYTPAEIALVPKNIREEYAALMEAAEAEGVDIDAILEDGARINENQTQEQYNEYVRQAITDAIADSRRQAAQRESVVQGREDAERGGTEGGSQNAGGQGAQEGLTAPTEADALRMGLGEFTAANADTLIAQPGGTWVLLDGRRASYENPDYSVVFSWGNGRWSSGDMASTPKAAHAVALKRWTDRGNSPESFKQASKNLFLSGVQGPDLLAAPTPAQVLEQQDRANRAEELDQRAQIDREASGFQLQTQTAEQRRENTGDMFGGPSVEDYQAAVERNRKPGTAPEGPDLFGGLTEQEATSEEQRIENLRKQLVDVEDKIVGAAGMAPGFIEDAMKSRKVPKEQKDRRNDLKAELRAARQRLSEQTAEAPDQERFAAGSALTKDQRKKVLDTLTDVYKTKNAPREQKGIGRDGNERYGYVYSPELFEKSDITGAMVRYYVTMPDGKIAHPSELFPDYTQSDIDAELDRRRIDADNKRQLVRSQYAPAAQQFDSVQEAGRFWDDKSDESLRRHGQWRTILPSLERTTLSNGDKFIMVPDATMNDQAMVEAFADEGWTPWKASAAEPAKPASEMSAAELLRAAADKMEAAEKAPAKEATPAEPINTENAGAELTANKRNRIRTGIKWSDIADKDAALRVSETNKANVYPRPDYEAMVEGGMQPIIAHLVKQAYDSLATGPQTGVRAPTDADLQTYIDGVQRYMDGVMKWANDPAAVRAWAGKVAGRAAVMLGASRGVPTSLSAMTESQDRSLLATVYPGGWKESVAQVRMIGGNKALAALQPSTQEATKALKDMEKGWPGKTEAWQKQGYTVVQAADLRTYAEAMQRTGKAPYVSALIRMPMGGRTADLANKIFDGLTSRDDPQVQTWLAQNVAALDGKFLLLDKYRRLVSASDTEDAAKEKARERTKRDGKTTVSDKGISVTAAEREGVQHRMEGEDISSDRLKDTFGFKGVNFGNWMLGKANEKERQLHLNHAFDSFMDLAQVLEVPPKALSLDGMLGLAIGAQGTGKYAAHFVPGVNEINLTRTSGAGSLAHEFGHALDHYFARQAGLVRMTDPYLTEYATRPVESDRVIDGNNMKVKTFGEDIRPEIVQAFKSIVQAMNKRQTTPEETALKNKLSLARAQKSVDGWLASIRKDFENLAKTGYYRDGKQQKLEDAGPLLAKFDALAERIKALDLGEGKTLIGNGNLLSQPVADLRSLYADVTGRVYSLDQIKGLQANVDHLKYLTESKEATAEHVPQMVATDYATAALRLDEGKKGKAYWSTNLEKFARAFDAYVSDKLEAQAAMNSYLSHTGKTGETVPAGEERKAINAAIQKLVDTIETRETDAGNVAMFSRTPAMQEKASAGLPLFRKGADQTTGLTPTQFTQALSEAFGPKVAERLQSKGVVVPLADQNSLPAHVVPFLRAGDVVFGFYDPRTDRTYAVLENLTPGMVKGLALHEVGVHYGFEAMLGADKYKQVMKRLDMMHAMGSKAVRAARKEAEANAARPAQVPEETLAYLVQNSPELGLIKEVIAKIKAFLFREFGIGGKYLTEADLHMLAKAAVQHAARTEPGGVEVPAFMRALDAPTLNSSTAATRIAEFRAKYPATPPSGMDIDAARAWLRDRRAAFDALVQELTPSADGLTLPVKSGGTWMVSREARPDGSEWRITRFDKNMEPQGHEAHNSAANAVADMVSWADVARLKDWQPEFSRTPQTDTQAFKSWFGDSVVTDTGKAGGTPLRVYHGTKADFTEFKSTRGGEFGPAIYLTDSPREASEYGDGKGWGGPSGTRIMPVYASIKNPYTKGVDAFWKEFGTGGSDAEGVAAAQAAGYDGIIAKRADRYYDNDAREFVDRGGELTHYIVFNPEQIKSAIGNNGDFDPANPDIRFSFAGARAATADRHALVTAQDRLSAGEDAETVRQETGWFQGNDGKWRFEISDAGAQLAQQVYFAERGKWYPSRFLADARDHGSDTGGTGTLGDVLEHPALFAAYPALRDMPVTAKIRKDQESGAFDGRFITATAENEGRLLSVLLHEIQHGIQHIEGFAMGGTPQGVAPILEKERFEAMANRDDALTAEFDALKLQYAGVPESEIPQEVANRVRQLRSEINAIRNTGWREASNPFARRQPTPEELFAGYRRLAGEVEARNTQARQKLTADQRRVTSPGSTADVADADVIVVFNGKEMANAPLPANAAPDAATTAHPLRTPAATIRAAITKAYGKLLGQLEAKGLATLAQTEAQAIEAAAQARAKKTGGDVAQIKRSLTAAMQGGTDLDVKRSADGSIQGFFDPQTGQSFLIADNLTAEAAPGVLMHEVGIHMAADGSMKALFNRAAMMLKLQRGNPFMKAVQDRMDAAGETSGEEAAAYIAEAYENDRANAPASVQRWLADLLAAVKAWMFKKGIMGADRLTVADIAAVARANARSMARDGGATGGQGFGTAFSRAPAGDQTQTEAFKRWFGDSKVVDADGRPLVVYHGTGVNVGNRGEFMSGDFNAFDGDLSGKSSKTGAPESAFFFTDKPDVASSYTVAWRGDFSEKYKDNANVMPVYISMAKPLKVNAKGENWRDILYKGEYRDLNEIVQLAKESGKYDGVIVAKVVDKGVGATTSKTSTTYVAFNPTQIKSATGNRGSYDPNDPNIMFSRGAVEEAPEQPPRPNMLARAVGYQSLDDAGSPEFTPGRMLYNLIGDATGPLLSKWSLKAASPELRQIMRKMKIDVAKAQETAAAVAKESMALTEDERQMVSDLIEKELQAGTIPPEHAIRLAATINTVMGKQTDELLRLGMLSPESAERWRGEYLPRFYESKLTATATASDLWADAVRKAAGGGKPLKGIRGKHLRGRGMYETIPVTQLADYETMGWEVRDPDYQPGLTDTGMVQVWRDFTRQERDRMGEIRDAGFRFVMGYMQTQKDIALGRMFEALASDPDMSSKYATEDLSVQVPTGNAPGTEVRTYGKLAGRFVSPETLSQLSMIEEAQSEALMMYRKAMGLWKESKTVLNPVAHANNVISNITMAHFAGVSYGRVDKYLAAIRDFATKSDDVLEAKDAGLFLGTMNEAELFNTLPEELKALAQTQEGTATKIGRSAFNLLSFYLRKPMGWAYQAEDTFFRYLIYKDARGRGLSPDDAVDYAQKFIFTYDDLPKRARQIRDYGIPFFAYTYRAIPALLETALTHPERFAAPMAVIMAANAAAYAIAAGDDDDSWELRLKKYLTDKEYREKVREKEKLERELLPEWLRGQTSLRTERTVRLGTDELTKLPMFIDISRMIPGGDMFDMHPNGGGIPWFQPLTPNHPLLSMYGAMHLNKDAFYGKDIINPKTDSDAEAARKRLDWIWKQMTPAIAYGNYHWERWMNALAQATGEEIQWAPEWATDKAIATGIGRDGLPVQPKYAAMQTFGIKVRPYDLDKAEAIAQSVSNKTVREIDAEMSSLRRLNNMGAVSDRTYERAKELADTKKDRLRDGQTVDGEKR